MLVNPVLISSSHQYSQNEYLVLAKRIVLVHKLLVYLVVCGALYLPFAPIQFIIFYTGYFVTVAVIPLCNKGKCPLTLMEKKMIRLGGLEPYQSSFIPYYFPFMKPSFVHIAKILISLTLIIVWIFQ